MGLPQHKRTEHGNFRQARGDETAGNLRKDYPEFNNVRADAKLENLRERFDAISIKEVRAGLRKLKK